MTYKSATKLPPFNSDGLLPPGDYSLTFSQLKRSFLVTGKNCSKDWDQPWRSHLVNNLEVLVNQLWTVGIERVFINGSFVEEKNHPNDIDGYFECDLRYYVSGKLAKDLNFLDPMKVWTWDPNSLRPFTNQVKLQLPMWLVYRVELYPQCVQLSGINDEFGNLPFASAFRQRRADSKPKGIILLAKGGSK